MPNPGRRRSNGELERDRRRIGNLYLKGWIQADIAKETGLSQSTISNDLKALHKEWRESALVDIDTAKTREIGEIDHLEREAWLGWLRSCEDEETTVQKERRGHGQEKRGQREMTQTTRGQAGDPRFLAIVDKCIARRCKIYGLDAPEKRELSGPDGTPLLDLNTIRVVVINGSDE